MGKARPDHCVIDSTQPTPVLKCTRCAAHEEVALPISVTALCERIEAFIETHKGCA
jgi:hypothetical protein